MPNLVNYRYTELCSTSKTPLVIPMRLMPVWTLIEINCDHMQKTADGFTFEGLVKVFSPSGPYALG